MTKILLNQLLSKNSIEIVDKSFKYKNPNYNIMKYDKILKEIEKCDINVERDEKSKIYNITIKMEETDVKYKSIEMIMKTINKEIEIDYNTKYIIL